MKSLAEFKREIAIGNKIQLVKLEEQNGETFGEVAIPEKLQGVRTVSYKDTTGFYLKQASDISNKKGSFCGYPKSANLAYDNNHFEIVERDNKGNIWQKRVYEILS